MEWLGWAGRGIFGQWGRCSRWEGCSKQEGFPAPAAGRGHFENPMVAELLRRQSCHGVFWGGNKAVRVSLDFFFLFPVNFLTVKLKGMFYVISSPSLGWKGSRRFDTLGWCCCLGRAAPRSVEERWLHLQSGIPTELWISPSAGCLHRNAFLPLSFIPLSLGSAEHALSPQPRHVLLFFQCSLFLQPSGWMNTWAASSQKLRSNHVLLLSLSNYSHCLEVSTDQ